MIQRIAIEAIEARLGRLLTDEEMTRYEIIDGYIVLLEMAQRGERLCLSLGHRARAEVFARASGFARKQLEAL